MPTATLIGAIATFGPAQVAGRIALLALGRHATASRAGRAAFVAFPTSVALSILFPHSIAALFAFSLVYGAANEIVTVVRGTAVPELLWRESYGAINGALTLPQNRRGPRRPMARPSSGARRGATTRCCSRSSPAASSPPRPTGIACRHGTQQEIMR